MSKKHTLKIEYVEAANISQSLRRIANVRGYHAAHRALLHALHESGCWSNIDIVRRVREALYLP